RVEHARRYLSAGRVIEKDEAAVALQARELPTDVGDGKCLWARIPILQKNEALAYRHSRTLRTPRTIRARARARARPFCADLVWGLSGIRHRNRDSGDQLSKKTPPNERGFAAPLEQPRLRKSIQNHAHCFGRQLCACDDLIHRDRLAR